MFLDKLYGLVRPLLFLLSAENAHVISMLCLECSSRLLSRLRSRVAHVRTSTGRVLMGCYFRNAVGLAAGLDKDGRYLTGLMALGFGHIEIGTVTLRPQLGNAPPRLWRKVAEESLFNRMGFNNKGLAHLCTRLSEQRVRKLARAYDTRIGVSIGINRDTPKHAAATELCQTYKGVYPYADYVAINFSSPNTKGLRHYQNSEDLTEILTRLRTVHDQLSATQNRSVPLVVKLSADQSERALLAIAPVLKRHAHGVIFSNTMLYQQVLKSHCLAKPVVYSGGISGRLLKHKILPKTKVLARALSPLPLIACGGIDSPAVARERIAAGAQLVQLYTGLIYKGPKLASHIAQALATT